MAQFSNQRLGVQGDLLRSAFERNAAQNQSPNSGIVGNEFVPSPGGFRPLQFQQPSLPSGPNSGFPQPTLTGSNSGFPQPTLGSAFPTPATEGASRVSFPGGDSSISRRPGGPQATLGPPQQFNSRLLELLQTFQESLSQQQGGGVRTPSTSSGFGGGGVGALISQLMQSLQTSGQFGGFGNLLGGTGAAVGGQLASRPAFRSESDRLGVNRF